MSDKPKHSPGPFTHNESIKRFGNTESRENTICDAHGNTLISEWYSSWWDSEDTQEVDLAPGDWDLFAAAPEMLEALKQAQKVVVFLNKVTPNDITFHNLCIDIESAIAKAEGRQE